MPDGINPLHSPATKTWLDKLIGDDIDKVVSNVPVLQQPEQAPAPAAPPVMPAAEAIQKPGAPPLFQRLEPVDRTKTTSGKKPGYQEHDPVMMKILEDAGAAKKERQAQVETTISGLPKPLAKWADSRASKFAVDKAALQYEIDNTKDIKKANALRAKLRAHEILYTRDIANASDEGLLLQGRGNELPDDRRVMFMPPEATAEQAKEASKYTLKYVLAPGGDVFYKGDYVSTKQLDGEAPSLAHMLRGGDTVSALKRESGAHGVLQELTGEGVDIDTMLKQMRDRQQFATRGEPDETTVGDYVRGKLDPLAAAISPQSSIGDTGTKAYREDYAGQQRAKTGELRDENRAARAAAEWEKLKGKSGKVGTTTKLMEEVRGGFTGSMIQPVSFLARAFGNDQLADEFDRKIGSLEAVTPEEEQNIFTKLANGAGSMLSFLAPAGVIGNVAKMGKTGKFLMAVVSGSMEAAAEAGNTYASMAAEGASPEEARAGMFQAFAGNVPLNVFLDKVGIFNPDAGKSLKRMLHSAGAEATQEAIQQVIQNAAQGKPLLEGVGESALIGGMLGGGTTGAHTIGRKVKAEALVKERKARPINKVQAEPEAEAPAPAPTPAPTTASAPAPKAEAAPVAGGEAAPKTALQAAKEAAAKPATTVSTVKLHPDTVKLTSSYGESGRVEGITQHTPDTSHSVANRAVAQSMFSLMSGAIKDAGVEIDDDVKSTIHNITDALGAPKAIDKVSKAWGEMGVPKQAIDALQATAAALKSQGLDINRSTMTKEGRPIPAAEAADRNWRFLNEFHKQLEARTQEMGTGAPEWMRGTVARIGKLVEPGGKYDNAYRQGVGLPAQERPVTHVPVAPIVAPVRIGELNRAASGGAEQRVPIAKPAATPKLEQEKADEQARTDGSARSENGAAPEGSPRAAGPVAPARRSLAEKVERAADPDELEAQSAGRQVTTHDLPPVSLMGIDHAREVNGRMVEVYGPVGPNGKRSIVSALVMSDGDIFIGGKENGGHVGLGKQLDKAVIELANQHFPESIGKNLIGNASESARKSRLSYPGTVIEEGSFGGENKPTSTPMKSVLEYAPKEASHAQAREGSVGPEGAAQEAAEPSVDRSGVSEGAGKVEAPGPEHEAGREPGQLLGETGGASQELSHEVQAFLAKHRPAVAKALEDALGVDDVNELPDEVPLDVDPEDGVDMHDRLDMGAPKVELYGPQQMLYPVQALAQGSSSKFVSPNRRVLNLTSGVFYTPEFAQAFGFKVKGNTPITGTMLMMSLVSRHRSEEVQALLRSFGFDGVAIDNSFGGVSIATLLEPEERMLRVGESIAARTILKTAKGTPVFKRVWGRKPDGSIGWLKGGPREAGDLTSPKPVEPKPIKHAKPIEDRVDRDQAVMDAEALLNNNHLATEDLLRLARESGVPLGDEEIGASGMEGLTTQEFKSLVGRASDEAGDRVSEASSKPDRTNDYVQGVKTYAPGELAHKFSTFIRDGGFSRVIRALAKSRDFLDAMEARERYGRGEFAPVSKALLSGEDVAKLYGAQDLGSDTVYRGTREIINSMVRETLSGKQATKAITQNLRAETLTPQQARIAALASIAAAKYIPGFFSVSPEVHEEMRAREMEQGAYDEGSDVSPLSKHYDVTPEKHESFMPNDVYGNAETMREESLGAGHEMPSTSEAQYELPARPAFNKLVGLVAARGGFTHEALAKAGVQVTPKANHKAAYETSVNEVLGMPGVIERLELEGVGILANAERIPQHLVKSGYANLLLNYRAGKGKKGFHVDAYNIDPEFKDHYTIGEQTVLQVNGATADGFPVPEHILSNREMAILLDQNHPMYNVTAENVIGKLASSKDIILSGTPMKRVQVTDRSGNKRSILVPRSRLTGDYGVVRHATAGVPSQVAPGLAPSGIRVTNQKLVRERLTAALAKLRNSEADWAQSLGEDLFEQYATAMAALDAAKNALSGDFSSLLGLDGVEAKIATRAFDVKSDINKLQAFADEAKRRLNDGKTPAEIVARARAREIMSIIDHAKSDVRWEEIFSGENATGVDVAIPTSVAEDAIRNNEEFMRVAEEMGITATDPNTKYAHEVLSKVHPLFFEELGTNISQDPNLDSGLFDSINRIIKMAGKLMSTATATQRAHIMVHEVAHAFTTYMSIPMQQVADRWFRSEREQFIAKNRMVADVLYADAIDPVTGEITSVTDAFAANGSLTTVVMVPTDASAVLAAHPQMAAHLTPQYDATGDLLGYKVNPHFAGPAAYRYLNLAEFIAETMKDAMRQHAHGVMRKKGKDWDFRDRYTLRLKQNAGAKSAMDALHRNMGRMIDTLVGKNTMRRYVGYLVNQGGLLERGLKEGSRDVAFPTMDWRGGDAALFRGKPGAGGPAPGKIPAAKRKLTPEDLAKRDHLAARQIGRWVNKARAMAMTQLNASSVSDRARSAGYALRGVLGELGVSYNTMANQVFKFYGAAHKAAHVDPAVRRWLKKNAEAHELAKIAKERGLGTVVALMAQDGKEYAVSIDAKGRYSDSTPMSNINDITQFEISGKFGGELAGLEEPLGKLNRVIWDRMSAAIGNLADQLSIDKENLAEFDELVKKVKHYYAHQYRSRIEGGFLEFVGGGNERQEQAGVGVYNAEINPEIDYGINAHMLMDRTFETQSVAIANGHFPIHTNAVENVVAGIANSLGVIARLDTLTNMLESGNAVPGYDGSNETRGWPTMQMSTVGLTDDMFGKALADIRIHPDAMRIMEYAFRADPLAKTTFGRYAGMVNGALNSTQLMGLNDYVSGMAAVSGFGGELKKGKLPPGVVAKRIVQGAAAVGAAATAAAGLGVVSGAVIGTIGAAAALTVIKKGKKMTAGTLEAISEGKKAVGIIASEGALHPERLPREAREFLAFAQAANIKIMENPIQLARAGKLVDQLRRQGKGAQASFHWAVNILNKLTQLNDIGAGPFGGKALAKLGMLKMLAPALMDKYRGADGNVDFTNPDFLREATQLSDDLDNQVGAVQWRNLHMNPSVYAAGRLIFRAWAFRFTTEKMKALLYADIANNIGTAGPWRRGFEAFREEATAGGTARPTPAPGSRFAWRAGNIALKNLLLASMALAMIQSIASHVIWPDSNYSQADFARRAYEQLAGRIGDKPARAFEGMLAILPHENSSLADAMRHIAMTSVAPQAGTSDATSGRPRNVIVPGPMYAKNITENPWELSWWASGVGPAPSLAIDAIRDKDALNRELGFGDPLRNIESIKRYNEWMQAHPEDDPGTALLRRGARIGAHVMTQLPSLTFRGANQVFDMGEPAGGAWFVPAAQALGGRAMGPTAGLSSAERLAYENMSFGPSTEARSTESVARSTATRAAKVEMLETGKTDKLDDLLEREIIPQQQHTKLKNEYLEPDGTPRANIVRLIRKMADSKKTKLKEVYMLARPDERAAIENYVNNAGGKGYTKEQMEKIQELKDWIEARGSK